MPDFSEKLADFSKDDPLDQFCERLEDSQLVSVEEVSKFRSSIPQIYRSRPLHEIVEPLIRDGKLTGYQAAMLIQEDSPTLFYGSYLILDQVGSGSSGVIYKVQHSETDEIAALKVLGQSLDSQTDFEWEIQQSHSLKHANIVTAFDTGEQDGHTWIAMEFVDGIDLSQVVKRQGALPWKRAIGYMIQAAYGLDYAHEKGIVHRDIKPSNLLLDAEDQIKILDLGVAKFSSKQNPIETKSQETLTGSGQVLGTANYLAPEQVDAGKVDRRADIYSLGCTLFSLLTSLPPYRGKTPLEVMQAHKNADIPKLREWLPYAPRELERVLLKMMAKSPDDRYQSMQEVVAELEPLLEIEDRQREPKAVDDEPTSGTERLPSGLRPLGDNEDVARASTKAFPQQAKKNYLRRLRDWTYWLVLQAIVLGSLLAVFYFSTTFPIENANFRLAFAGGLYLFHHLIFAVFGYVPDEFQPRTLMGAVLGLFWGPLYYYLGGPYIYAVASAANWFLVSATRIQLPLVVMMALLGSITLGSVLGLYRSASKRW